MYPHSIRLRGPWECEPLRRDNPGRLPPPFRVTMPCRWQEVLGDFAGQLRWRRRFGLPRRLDANERVWLSFTGPQPFAGVALNGQPLYRDPRAERLEFEVTALLRQRNELTVEMETKGEGPWQEAILEIRSTAWLRRVGLEIISVDNARRLKVTGEVAGSAARPLDLYVLVNGQNQAYTTAAAAPQGNPFVVETAGSLPAEDGTVRVELVDGGVVWDRIERALFPEASSANIRPS